MNDICDGFVTFEMCIRLDVVGECREVAVKLHFTDEWSLGAVENATGIDIN